MAVNPYRSFTPETCLELISTLSTTQLTREANNILGSSFIKSSKTRLKDDTMRKNLKEHFSKFVGLDQEMLHTNISKLTETISRELEVTLSATQDRLKGATVQMEQLQEKLDSAQNVIAALTTSSTPLSNSQPGTSSSTSNGTAASTGTLSVNNFANDSFPDPFEKFEGAPFDQFELKVLDSACDYDQSYKNRSCAYYGELPYRYSGGYHKARPITENSQLQAIVDKVKELHPDYKFNSAMVTKYDGPSSSIPPHSDDEDSIVPGSNIMTISLGGERQVCFRRKPPHKYVDKYLTVKHGEVYTMTRDSQELWDHGIPQTAKKDYKGVRISVTLRLLRDTSGRSGRRSTPSPQQQGQNGQSQADSSGQSRKLLRVLLLTDSRNREFDCSRLRDPVVAFRKDLFLLRDIEQHRASIEQSDLVLISSGINDLRLGRSRAADIHDKLKSFTRQFKAQFLFEAVAPMSMNADRFNTINAERDKLNRYLFQLSLRQENFKLFDNLSFGLAHLARDGLHLNNPGKAIVSSNWVECILIRLGFYRGSLPIRREFRRIAYDFNDTSRSR